MRRITVTLFILTILIHQTSQLKLIHQWNRNTVTTTNQDNFTKYSASSEFAPFYQYFERNYGKVDQLSQQQKIGFKIMLSHLQQSRFSIKALRKTCDLSYNLYKTGKQKSEYFWFFSFHILFAFAKQGRGFNSYKQNLDLQKKITQIIKELQIKYPPIQNLEHVKDSQKILNFKVDPLPDLLQGKPFKNVKELQQQIQKLNKQSQKQLKQFRQFINQTLSPKCDSQTLKSGTKLPADNDSLKYRKSMSRIQDKMFNNQINYKRFRQQANYQDSYLKYFQKWQRVKNSQINNLLKNNQKKQFTVYDLLRAKCQFGSVQDIIYTLELLNKTKKYNQKQIKIIVIKNRLAQGTMDVHINLKFGDLITQIQLGLQFDIANNQFNHKLYELSRNPSGVVLASLLQVINEDNDQLEFYRDMISSFSSQLQIRSFDFFLTVIQQFIPSYFLINFVNSQSHKKQAHKESIHSAQLVKNSWNCVFYEFQSPFLSIFDQFNVKNETITGEGVDMFGMFFIQGQKTNQIVYFQKKYLKYDYSFYYQGQQRIDQQVYGNYGMIKKSSKSEYYGPFFIKYVKL